MEQEKDALRKKKKQIEVTVVGKEIDDINVEMIRKCLDGMKEVEKSVENLF